MPVAASVAVNELPGRVPDVFAEPGAPESGPYLKPNESLAPDAYAVGQVLAGKYRVERLIGEGAMGLVLAATHLGLDEIVAIKFMRAEVQRLPGTLSRFAKEAKIAARIRSEHVTKVIDVGVSEPIGPYIVMEHLDGRTLADVLEAEGPLPVQRAAEYLLQACEGLAAAHALGVTHRDIKPENLFITAQPPVEVVKLLDFGISKATLTGRVFGDDLALSKSSYVMGTPLYMSPEQIRAAPHLDSRTDIWSMGAVLYELVSGNTAFSAESMTEICAKILEAPAPRFAPPSPPDLAAVQAIVDKCLEKDPQRRFQSVADLALALLPLASERARAYADRSSNLLAATRPSGPPGTSQELVVSSSRNATPDAAEPRAQRRRSWLPAIALALAALVLLAALAIRFSPVGLELVSVPRSLSLALQSRAEPAQPPAATRDVESSAESSANQGSSSPPSASTPARPAAEAGLAPGVVRKGRPQQGSVREGAARKQGPAPAAAEPPETNPISAQAVAAPSPIRLMDAQPRLRLVEPPPLLAPSSPVTPPKRGTPNAPP